LSTKCQNDKLLKRYERKTLHFVLKTSIIAKSIQSLNIIPRFR